VDTTAQLETLLGRLRRAPFPPIEGFDAGRQMDAETTSLLGFAYASQGRVPLGIEYMERSVQMAPGQAPLWVGLGHRYLEVGRRAEAEAAYRHALAIDPQQLQARRALGQLIGDAGQAAEVTGRSR
jgi:Flp pilus assembly protein TadD